MASESREVASPQSRSASSDPLSLRKVEQLFEQLFSPAAAMDVRAREPPKSQG